MRGVYYLCAVKPRQTRPSPVQTRPLLYKVQDKDTIKSGIMHYLSVENIVYDPKVAWRKSFKAFSTSRKQAVNNRLLLRLPDAVSICRE